MTLPRPERVKKTYSAGYGHRPSLFHRTSDALRSSFFGERSSIVSATGRSDSIFLKSDDLKSMNDIKMTDMSVSREGSVVSEDEYGDDYHVEDEGNFWSDRVAIFQKNMYTLGGMIGGGDYLDENPQDGPLSTFKKNMGTIQRRLSPNQNDAVLKRDLSEYLMEIDDDGNPQDTSKHGMLSTFTKNVASIFSSTDQEGDDKSLHGVSNFVKARVDTFSNNINFAQDTAESITRDLGTLVTFSKNIDSLQAQAKSLTEDLGSNIAFSKNMHYAHEQAKSITSDLGPTETFQNNMSFAMSRAEFMTQPTETFQNNINFAQSRAQSITSGIARVVSERSLASYNNLPEPAHDSSPVVEGEVPDVHESM